MQKRLLVPLGIVFALSLSACGAGAETETQSATASGSGVKLKPVGKFSNPVYVTAPPGDSRQLFVVEQGGTVRIVRGGKKLTRPFLDISSKVVSGGEQGLLSIAFAPDYTRSGKFYVYYTAREDGGTRVVEYRRKTTDRADGSSARVVLGQDQPESNHNGGQLQFGPDGYLYIGLGDGGGGGDQHGERGNGQDLGTLLGKLLRINPQPSGGREYTIPSDNPFVDKSGARPEIYSYGLRNPWRFSFDRKTGDLGIGDVGQDSYEEIDFVLRGRGSGANFGWRVYEGKHRFTEGETAQGAIKPVLEYGRSGGACSVTGGYVVRDPDLNSLAGRYVYGDFCIGKLRTAKLSPKGASGDRALGLRVPNLSSLGEDNQGRVYAVSLDGPVYRLD